MNYLYKFLFIEIIDLKSQATYWKTVIIVLFFYPIRYFFMFLFLTPFTKITYMEP